MIKSFGWPVILTVNGVSVSVVILLKLYPYPSVTVVSFTVLNFWFDACVTSAYVTLFVDELILNSTLASSLL